MRRHSKLIKGVDISGNAEFERIAKNTDIKAVFVGGDAGDATKIIDGNVDVLKDIIKNGARYSKKSPAMPIDIQHVS